MSSATSKASCVTCNKGIGQFKCEGCSQTFCTKHVAEHRQALCQQLDEVILEHDIFLQTIIEDKNPSHSLMVYIDQWEQKSIDKIRQTAKEVREKVSQLENTYKKSTEIITQELNHLKEQIKRAREEDDFFENDLRNWLSILEKLKQELKTASLSSNIKEDQTSPLVHQIQMFSLSSNTKFMHLGASNPVNEIHPRLQYTNKDGIYVNPRSAFVTAIWYFYSPNYNRWFWTPYKNYEIWMSVNNLIVKSGYYKGQQPAQINVEIIGYLQQNNPIPPDGIIREASEAENRILKL